MRGRGMVGATLPGVATKRGIKQRLKTYRAKRRFDRTPEPAGKAPRSTTPGWRFVVQKHDARRLHYDFRLELDGVLLSWAVPKGPSMIAGERRLAVRTEDHPMAYHDFEGVIPEGEYGGGTVVVWDHGTWRPDGDPRAGLRRGRLTFELTGEKLRGRFHLVKTRLEGAQEGWLLFKGRDAAAVARGSIVDQRPESALTGRTVAQVAAARDRVWHSSRPANENVAAQRRRGAPAQNENEPAAAGDLPALVKALPADAPFTNLDKLLYPEQGLTKAMVIAYVAVTADWSLPHLGGRPLTLVRCPDGLDKECWFQKHAAPGMPPSIGRVPIAEEDGETKQYLVVDDLKGLVACAQLGALELHTWGAHADKPERPDLVVFDVDPDPALGWDAVVEAALGLRDALAALGLASWVKTTGGKGLHVTLPIQRTIGWDDLKAWTRAFAERFAAAAPDRYTTNPLKARRKGKVFVDYLRNGRGATFIAPYSMRRRPGAPVATPLTWAELERGVDPAAFTVRTVPARLAALRADPWRELATAKQRITAAMRRAVGIK